MADQGARGSVLDVLRRRLAGRRVSLLLLLQGSEAECVGCFAGLDLPHIPSACCGTTGRHSDPISAAPHRVSDLGWRGDAAGFGLDSVSIDVRYLYAEAHGVDLARCSYPPGNVCFGGTCRYVPSRSKRCHPDSC